jgi:hypothetical protein
MAVVLISLDFQKFSDIYFSMKNIVLVSLFSLSFILNTPFALSAEDEKSAEQAQKEPKEASNEDDSASMATSKVARVTPDQRNDQRKDIAQYLENSLTEVITLTALEEEFDVYYHSADEKEPLGSLLFFPDERTHADWPVNLNPLRTGLTRHKWQTAVISLPTTQLPALPERSVYTNDTPASSAAATTDDAQAQPAGSDPDSSQGNETAENTDADSKTMNEIIAARATATAAMLKEKSDVLIITGIGQGATWATAFALNLPPSDLENTRLLLINPMQSEDISSPKLNELIGQLKVDTFDIYTPIKKNNRNTINQALARKRAANQSDIENYSQIKAPKRAWQSVGNDWLYRKVRGLLKNKVEKMLAQKEEEKANAEPVAAKKMNQKPGSN